MLSPTFIECRGIDLSLSFIIRALCNTGAACDIYVNKKYSVNIILSTA